MVESINMILSKVDKDIVAVGVSYEEYMEDYAANFHEWVNGVVIKMAPVTDTHDELTAYFRQLLDAYFVLNPIGKVRSEPFVMRLPQISAREPDLQVILNSNSGQYTPTAMIGAADICIEVVSPESVERDYGKKFQEYETGGVGEYWIIDPVHKTARFHRLEDGLYTDVPADDEGYYQTPKLSRLKLHVPTLWQDPLPDIFAIAQAVKEMVGES